MTTSPSKIIDNCLPDSESNAGNQIGPTEDVSLLWLKPGCSTEPEVVALETQSPANYNIAGIGQIFWGSALAQMFNAPGPPPKDPRTPDIIVTPNIGVTYSKITAKQAEHGGFAHDDTNVMLLLWNPSFSPQTFTSPVQTAQVVPTLLRGARAESRQPAGGAPRRYTGPSRLPAGRMSRQARAPAYARGRSRERGVPTAHRRPSLCSRWPR